MLSLISRKRTKENCKKLVEDVKNRTSGRIDILISSDNYAIYESVIEEVYSSTVSQVHSPEGVSELKTKIVMPDELGYVVVSKRREKGSVVEVIKKIVFGTMEMVEKLLLRSKVSMKFNTSFVERNNGTERGQNSRKRRKSYCFSKNWEIHNAVSYFIGFSYNFCWSVRTLRLKEIDGRWKMRTPAMAAGLTDHIWTVEEWVTYPAKGG